MADQDRPTSAQLLRATSILARTVYKELKRAHYTKDDVLRFVNELVDLLTRDARTPGVDPQGLFDPHTGLPNADVLGEILAFEFRRAREASGRLPLLVVALSVTIPELSTDAHASAIHERVRRAIRGRLRATDGAGRIAPERYLLVLPTATVASGEALLSRLADAIGAEGPLPHGVTVEARSASLTPEVATAEELLERCLAAPPVRLLPAVAVTAATRPVAAPTAHAAGDRGTVVLALGGGAARAIAHLGVLRVLRRAGVRPVAIAGTSAGALVGALTAAGVDEEEALGRFVAFAASPLYRQIRRAFALFRARSRDTRSGERYFRNSSLAFLSERTVAAIPDDLYDAFIEAIVGPDRDIATLPMPFAGCATDLVEGRPVYLNYGPLHATLKASCAIPGLFPPQPAKGRLLVDGAVVAEVPIGAARQLPARAPLLAVYLDRPLPRVERFASSTEIAVRVNALVHTEMVREQLRHASLLLRVPMEGVHWLAFRDAEKIARIGQRKAEVALDGLLAALERLETP